MTKHTEGPWIIGEIDCLGDIVVRARDVLHVAHICTDSTLIPDIEPITEEEQEANARLIAASPELLEALIEASNIFDNYPHLCTEFKGTFEVVQNAIAKARGQ